MVFIQQANKIPSLLRMIFSNSMSLPWLLKIAVEVVWIKAYPGRILSLHITWNAYNSAISVVSNNRELNLEHHRLATTIQGKIQMTHLKNSKVQVQSSLWKIVSLEENFNEAFKSIKNWITELSATLWLQYLHRGK